MIENIFSPIPPVEVIDRAMRWHQSNLDAKAKTRLLYLECKRNLALLSCVDLSDKSSSKASDDDYLEIAKQLDKDVLEMIFIDGEEGTKFFKYLKTINEKFWFEKEIDSDADEKELNLANTAMQVYLRISVIQKIAKMNKKGEAMKKIFYRTRLRNIQTALLQIVKSLHEKDEIKDLQEN